MLFLRRVDDPSRVAMAVRLLDEGPGGRGWRASDQVDLWELQDLTSDDGDEPVAVAATSDLGDARRVRLLGVAVAPAHRGCGISRRMVEELKDALRARGVLTLATAIPEGVGDQVWFDVEL